MLRNLICAFFVAAALSAGCAAPAQSQDTPAQPPPAGSPSGQTTPTQTQKQVTLNSFKSAPLWPIWAAQDRGLFQGLAIKNLYTADSSARMIGFVQGESDIVISALDDVTAYAEGEGSPRLRRNAG